MHWRLLLFLLICWYRPAWGQSAGKAVGSGAGALAAPDSTHSQPEAEKLQTISLTDYGINARIDVPVIDGYELNLYNTGKKKEHKILIVVGPAYRMTIEAEATTFSDAEIYLGYRKKAETDLWYKDHPADPPPVMILNEPNAYVMQLGKEYRLAYLVTIDNVRYTITTPNYLYDPADALRYIRLAKTFFPK